MNFGIAEVYYGDSGKMGYYNSQQLGLSRAMKKLGYKCFIFMPDIHVSEPIEDYIESDITVVRCPAKAIGVHARFDWSIIKSYNVDVVQVGSDNHIFAGDLIKYCDRNGILAYNYFGTVYTKSHNKVKKAILELVFRRNVELFNKHMNFAKTEKVKGDLERFGITNSQIVPVGLDTTEITDICQTKEQLRDELGIPQDAIALLYVGRIEPNKNPKDILTLIESIQGSCGIVIGNGSLAEEFEQEIIKRDLINRILWIKELPNSKVHNYYKAADYYVNFCEHEIFGMSILEAMYQGCTVIALHAPGPDMIIENDVSGYLVSDYREMTHLIEAKKHLPDDVIRNRIINSFTWDCAARCFDERIKGELCSQV